MRAGLLVVVLGAGVLVGARAIEAHHAFAAEFDANRPVSLEGAVTKVDWFNPHAWVYLDVVEADGKTVNWAIELAAPNGLIRRGFNKDSVPIGTKILVKGYQAKDGGKRANGAAVTFPDGRRVFVGSSGTGAPEEPPK
jgi:hypothetical protein